MAITFSRITLLLAGLLFGYFGLLFLFFPNSELASVLPLKPSTNAGLGEIRAIFGGMELALAIFFLHAAITAKYLNETLILSIGIFAGFGFGRLLGLLLDDLTNDGYTQAALAIETISLILCVSAFVIYNRHHNIDS